MSAPQLGEGLGESKLGDAQLTQSTPNEPDRLRYLATLPPEQWPVLMTIAEAAAVCRISPRLLFAWRHTHQGPRAVLQGKRRWGYPRHRVIAYLETIGVLPMPESRLKLVKRSAR